MVDNFDIESKEFLKKMLEQMQSQQNEDDDDNTPLTKPKRQAKKAVITEGLQKEQVVKPRKKMPPKTEKQMQQFQVAMQKRKESIEKKKLEKKIEASKLLLQHGITPTPTNTPTKPTKVAKKVVAVSEESSDEEIVIQTVKKPKKKRVIKVEVSDSSDDEPDYPPQAPHAPVSNDARGSKSQFRKQQYQKPSSVIKVHDDKPKYYFAE